METVSVKCEGCAAWFTPASPAGGPRCPGCAAEDEAARVACDVATPAPFADALVAQADLGPWARALEPSAGRGAIVRPLLATGAAVTACELHAPHAQALRALGAPPRLDVRAVDFLAQSPDALGAFDAVVMSPPFRAGRDPRADLTHLRRALQFLLPGGRLVAVLHARLLDRDEAPYREAREELDFRQARFTRCPPDVFGPDAPAMVCCTLERPAPFDFATFGRLVQEALPRWTEAMFRGQMRAVARAAAWFFVRPVVASVSRRTRAAWRAGTVAEAVPRAFEVVARGPQAFTTDRALVERLLRAHPVSWEELDLPAESPAESPASGR